MKKSFLILIISLIFSSLNAQNIASKFRVTFTDKNNSPYSISDPSQYLSAKALERRNRQGISIQPNDLPVNSWYVDSVRNTGALVYTVSKWFNCVTIKTTDAVVLTKILSLPFVAGIDTLAEQTAKKVEKGKKKKDKAAGSQSISGIDADFYSQVQEQLGQTAVTTANKFDYGQAFTQAHMLGTDSLHSLGFRGENITIAVLDAGFNKVDSISTFDSLWMNNQILGTKDFVEPGGNVFIRSDHGMSVLSIMGGNIPGKIIGTAPKAHYWLLRTEDAVTEYPVEEDNWVCGAEFADSVGADIINSSLGYTVFYNPKWNHTYQDMNGHTCRSTNGADLAASKGILVCNSAGNSGNGQWHYIGAPADADNIITVGAVDAQGNLADFSSRGPSSDGRIKPTVCAMGAGTFVSSITGSVTSGSGTSYSSPVMAGSVACLWQSHKDLSNMKIIQAVIASANRYNAPDSGYGYGIPNLIVANLILNGLKIDNFDEDNVINVFPNPIVDYLNLVFYSSDTSAIDVQMFDLSGRLVFSKEKITRTPGCNSIPIIGLGDLSKGYYMLKVFSGTHAYSVKVLKTQ
jgi:serine protease AprX